MDFKDPSISREDKLEHLRQIMNKTKSYREFSSANSVSKPVYCPTLNKTFSSIKEVCVLLSLHRSSVKSVLNGQMKTTGGFEFKWYVPSEHPKPR